MIFSSKMAQIISVVPDEGLITREVRGKDDVEALVRLCGVCFPEEAQATGISHKKWREVQTDELLRNPAVWEQCGVAIDTAGSIVGAVVMTVENEPEAGLSYWEVNRRFGCLPSLLTMCYDQVLEETLENHECLIDFLAVSSEARGKGVGSALMRWAEKTAVDILTRREPEATAANGTLLTLWVAADNLAATRLYAREGYTVVRRTNDGLYACLTSRILQRFLGHPVWWKMQKQLARGEVNAGRFTGKGKGRGEATCAPKEELIAAVIAAVGGEGRG